MSEEELRAARVLWEALRDYAAVYKMDSVRSVRLIWQQQHNHYEVVVPIVMYVPPVPPEMRR